MRIINVVILSLLLCAPSYSYAKVDKEIRESMKCSELFSYYEQRYNIPKNTLHSISLQESQKYSKTQKMNIVWPWTVNVHGKGYHFKSKQEAIDFVKLKQKSGIKSIDVGCMQINLKYHPKAFTSLDQAFTPRKNIEYAAKMLTANYSRTKSWSKAIGNYHSKTPSRSAKYHAKVAKLNRNIPKHKIKLAQINNEYSSLEDFVEEMHYKLNDMVFKLKSSTNNV